MKKPDNKPERRKIVHSYESLQLQRNGRGRPTVQDRLHVVGYRSKEQYVDCVSHLAW